MITIPKYLSLPTNTTEIVDNLSSDKTDAALSAKQGRLLNNKINNIPSLHISAGKNIKVDYKGNVCTVSYDGSNRNKYTEQQIDHMLTKWVSNTHPIVTYSSIN